MSAPLNLGALARETGVPRWQIVSTLGPWLWRFAFAAAIAAAVGIWVQPSSFPWLAALGASAALLYSLAVVAPLLQSPAGVYLRPLIGRATSAVSGLTARKRDNLPAAP